ncbi:MAG: hypothetical protein ACYS67_09085 [Planctomycetota bacterium]|jgi:hypothetical protein
MNWKYIGLGLNAVALFLLLWATRGIVWEDSLSIGLAATICGTSCLLIFIDKKDKKAKSARK